jgi:outer membrane receptor protein involved in Fe transport
LRKLAPLSLALTGALIASAARAQTDARQNEPAAAPAPPAPPAPSPPPPAVSPIYQTIVTATTPLHGSGLPLDHVPSNVQTATGGGIAKTLSLDLSQYMNQSMGSVHVNDVQNNPLQPDLQYRGFLASPLLGAPQGLSVYMNGVRLNEVFGDTVNWDLLPQSAIRTLNLMPGSNPLFGLNTLGGALSLETKTGFSDPGAEVRLSGGSFDRRLVGVQVGAHGERLAYYFAADMFKEDGWRAYSPTEAARALLATTYRSAGTTVDLTLSAAESDLNGNGPAPVQLLAQDWRAIFTHPDRTKNRLTLATLRGEQVLSPHARLSGVAYVRRNRTTTFNGDQGEWARCQDPASAAFVCSGDDDGDQTPVTDAAGQGVPYDAVRPYDASDNTTATTQYGYGLAAQLAVDKPVAARENHAFAGASVDEGRADFTAQTALARLSPTRGTLPTDIVDPASLVAVDSLTRRLGVYASDTFSLRPDLFLSLSARYNLSTLTLEDRLGDDLSGHHRFQRLNPAAGLSYQPRRWLGAFGGYSESTRTPTPLELTCANPDAPCRLPNSFLSDPPLEQVVARTFEVGVRGRFERLSTTLSYDVAAFRTTNDDDIIFISAGAVTNLGYFSNVGQTRRQGVEAGLTGRQLLGAAGRVEWSLRYTWLDATFQTTFDAPSPNHPDADDEGSVEVTAGARLPGVPRHLGKATVTWVWANRLSVAANVVAQSSQVRRADEANLLDRVPGFAVLDLRASYDIATAATVFLKVSNVFDTRYSTFSVLGDASTVLGPGYDNPRFNGPGAPRAAWAGLVLRY